MKREQDVESTVGMGNEYGRTRSSIPRRLESMYVAKLDEVKSSRSLRVDLAATARGFELRRRERQKAPWPWLHVLARRAPFASMHHMMPEYPIPSPRCKVQ